MFGPKFISVSMPERTNYVTREVTEKRAPTDESVRLLKEMEQAARDKIIASVNVPNTVCGCVVHTTRDCDSDEIVLKAIFRVNGHENQAVEYRFRANDYSTHPTRHGISTEHAIGLKKAIAERLAAIMLSDAWENSLGRVVV